MMLAPYNRASTYGKNEYSNKSAIIDLGIKFDQTEWVLSAWTLLLIPICALCEKKLCKAGYEVITYQQQRELFLPSLL